MATTAAEQAALPGFHLYNGIGVCHVEDGDFVTAFIARGHHTRDDVWTAFDGYARDRLHWPSLAAELAEGGNGPDNIHNLWAVVSAGGLDWRACPLDDGSFPVTVLDPEYLPPTPEEKP